MDLGRVGRVIGGERDVEEEKGVVVGRAGGSDDDGSEQVDAGLVGAHVDGVREVLLQNLPLLHDLLLNPAAAAAAVFVVDVVVV